MIFVQTILLAAHLLAMNVAASGPLACIAVQWVRFRDRTIGDQLGRRLAHWSLGCFGLGAVIGLANGWLLWIGGNAEYFAALERLPSKIYFGLWELAFYVLCMVIYIAWWKWLPPRSAAGRIGHAIVALAAASNLLWHFPALMTAIAHLAATSPEGETINAAGFRELIFQAELASRWLHVWIASFATCALLTSWLAHAELARRPLASDDRDAASLNGVVTWGGRIALLATLSQVPLGMWVLLSSGNAEQARLMGGNIWATGLLVTSILTALALMHQLAAIALGNATARNLRLALLLLSLTITAMSATLVISRA